MLPPGACVCSPFDLFITSIHLFYPSILLDIHSFVCLSIHPSSHLFVYPSVRTSIYTFVHPSIHPSTRSSIHPSIRHIRPFVGLFICKSIHPYIHSFLNIAIGTSIHLLVYPFIFDSYIYPSIHSCFLSIIAVDYALGHPHPTFKASGS